MKCFVNNAGAGCGVRVEPDRTDVEVVVIKGLCNRVKSRFFVQNGKAMLTNRRFIYLKHGIGKIFAISLLANLTGRDVDFEIPLSDSKSIEDGRQGFSKTIKIHTFSGEEFHFYFSKREEWKIALQNALEGNH